MDNLIVGLTKAPDTQIDPQIKVRLNNLLQLPLDKRKDALKKILDDCAYASLASDFAMKAMDIVWRTMP